jgi:hypothetical protein
MPKPPEKLGPNRWRIDLPADRFRQFADGTFGIEMRTADLKPGGAMYGIEPGGGDVEFEFPNGPDIPNQAETLRWSLAASSNKPDDLELKRIWDTEAYRDSDGVFEVPEAIRRLRSKDGGTVTVDPRNLHRLDRPGHPEQPTLSDQLMFERKAFPGAVPHKLQEQIKLAHRTSRAFVFDRAASWRLGEICAYSADLIADHQEFARPPYPRTWVEYDAMAFCDSLEAAGLMVERDPAKPMDERVGFLFTDKHIYIAASAPTRDDKTIAAGWSPWRYKWHQPMTREQEEMFCYLHGCSRMQIDQFFWGSAYDIMDPSRRRSFRAQHGVETMLSDPMTRFKRGDLGMLLTVGAAGELKTALAAALLLIRPNMTSVIETREPGRKMVGNKPTVFIAHKVVTIKLDPDRLVRRIRVACKEEAGRKNPRWHEVRAHYCHNKEAKRSSCIHDWEQIDENRWTCRKGCGGRRWWRVLPNGRGTAETGIVTKHYVVKP